jgi:hypothetical protein
VSAQARAWLALRAGAVPPSLEARMEAAVDAVGDGRSVHRDLADAALRCLLAAARLGDDRGAALHLLAADALITAACEAAAEAGPAALEAVRADATPARLADLMVLPAVPTDEGTSSAGGPATDPRSAEPAS